MLMAASTSPAGLEPEYDEGSAYGASEEEHSGRTAGYAVATVLAARSARRISSFAGSRLFVFSSKW